MLLDTTVFLDYLGGDPGAGALINEIVSGRKTAAVSPLTVQRLWARPGLDRRTEIGLVSLLSFVEDAPPTRSAARMSGLWLAASGQTPDSPHAYVTLLAATALERKEPIFTRNKEPFLPYYPDVVSY